MFEISNWLLSWICLSFAFSLMRLNVYIHTHTLLCITVTCNPVIFADCIFLCICVVWILFHNSSTLGWWWEDVNSLYNCSLATLYDLEGILLRKAHTITAVYFVLCIRTLLLNISGQSYRRCAQTTSPFVQKHHLVRTIIVQLHKWKRSFILLKHVHKHTLFICFKDIFNLPFFYLLVWDK